MIRSPGFIIFLAGIAASAGTAYFTAIPAVNEPAVRGLYLLLCASPWLLLSWLFAEIGTLVENARRRVDLLSSPYLKPDELSALEEKEMALLRPAIRRRLCWSVVVFVFAIAAPRMLL